MEEKIERLANHLKINKEDISLVRETDNAYAFLCIISRDAEMYPDKLIAAVSKYNDHTSYSSIDVDEALERLESIS